MHNWTFLQFEVSCKQFCRCLFKIMIVYEENPFLATGEFICAAKLIVANEQFCRQGWAELSWNIHGDFREHFSSSSSSHSDQYRGLCECTLARTLFLHFATSIPYKHTKCSLYLLQFLTKTHTEEEREGEAKLLFQTQHSYSHIETTNLIVWESVSLYRSGCRGVANCGNFIFFLSLGHQRLKYNFEEWDLSQDCTRNVAKPSSIIWIC